MNRIARLSMSVAGVLALGLGVALVPNSASADTVSDPDVGSLSGHYVPSPSQDYRGTFYNYLWGYRCVRVERKNAGGGYVTTGINGGTSCSTYGPLDWTILDNAIVSDTYGIRLKVTTGPRAGDAVNLCSSKAACLDMR